MELRHVADDARFADVNFDETVAGNMIAGESHRVHMLNGTAYKLAIDELEKIRDNGALDFTVDDDGFYVLFEIVLNDGEILNAMMGSRVYNIDEHPFEIEKRKVLLEVTSDSNDVANFTISCDLRSGRDIMEIHTDLYLRQFTIVPGQIETH